MDDYGNVDTTYRGKVHFTSTPGSALVPPDYQFTDTDAGMHEFNITFTQVGVYSLEIGDIAMALLKGKKDGIVVHE
jgi:hypothetical protein